MRTTITPEDDVAATLNQLRRTRQESFKDLVNEALREGLRQMQRPRKRSAKFHTNAYDAGRLLIPSIESVSEATALGEGDWHK